MSTYILLSKTYDSLHCDHYGAVAFYTTGIPNYVLFTPNGLNLNNEHEIQLTRSIYPIISSGSFYASRHQAPPLF